MTKPEEGFYFRDIYCYPDLEEQFGFYFLPDFPTPELDLKGQPILMLWQSEKNSRLQFGVQWRAAEETLEKLPMEIIKRYPERKLSAPLIKLMPVQAQIDSVRLSIGDGRGHFTDLQTVQSSGFYPYNALFNILLTSQQGSQVKEALNGHPDYLKVTYRGSYYSIRQGTVQIDVSADPCTWFTNGSGIKHVHVIP